MYVPLYYLKININLYQYIYNYFSYLNVTNKFLYHFKITISLY
jgi:hypothetical protein